MAYRITSRNSANPTVSPEEPQQSCAKNILTFLPNFVQDFTITTLILDKQTAFNLGSNRGEILQNTHGGAPPNNPQVNTVQLVLVGAYLSKTSVR